MKKLLVTKRVDVVKTYHERRDAIDQSWCDFIMACGFLPIYATNFLEYVQAVMAEISFSGIILTGGNDLQKYGGDAPERDEIENYLINYAIENNIPLIGICRGMQQIQNYFGVSLQKVSGYINTTVNLKPNLNSPYFEILAKIAQTKVYHQWGTHYSVPELKIAALDPNGVVMAVEHEKYSIFGMMWHPERQKPFNEYDMLLFQQIMEPYR